MTQQDRDRLWVLRQVAAGELSVSEGARRVGLGVRHFRRVLRRFEVVGDAAVVHRARGRAPNNAKPADLRERAVAKAHEALYRDFGPTLLAEHLAREEVVVHPHTLRRWLIDDGCWKVRRQGKRHRRRRARRKALGEMVLMDTCIHDWLEGRGAQAMVLIAMIDDATGRLFCRFFPGDTGAANRQQIIAYLERFGRPGAFYTDRAGHFQTHFRARARRERDEQEALTVIRRGLNALGIELILALSPQAKGRVERLFRTLQDRLLKEMRLAAIASLEQANRFLEEEFIPFYNGRFVVEPAEPADAHRPLPDVQLLATFADTDTRVIRPDFTFRFQNQHYQIDKPEAHGAMPNSRIVVEERVDGSRHFLWRGRYLQPQPIAAPPTASQPPRPLAPRLAPTPKAPAANHPWRQYPVRVGHGRLLVAAD